jgi:hypothetical protein
MTAIPDTPCPVNGDGARADGMFHYLVPTVCVETVEMLLSCRSAPGSWCSQDGACRYVQTVTWAEHPQVMTEVDYAGEATVAHAGHVDFLIVGETDTGARRYAWFYRSDVTSPRRWWQPQQMRSPWLEVGHFLDGDSLLFGAGDSWTPVTGAAAATAGYSAPPGRREGFRHAAGCAECRCDVLSQRADWQRTHLGDRYWGRSATKVLQ